MADGHTPKVPADTQQSAIANQLEALLEDAHIKLSCLVSDLLGVSARRMLKAIADGARDPTTLAALADKKLRATQAQLCDALGACSELQPVYTFISSPMYHSPLALSL